MGRFRDRSWQCFGELSLIKENFYTSGRISEAAYASVAVPATPHFNLEELYRVEIHCLQTSMQLEDAWKVHSLRVRNAPTWPPWREQESLRFPSTIECVTDRQPYCTAPAAANAAKADSKVVESSASVR